MDDTRTDRECTQEIDHKPSTKRNHLKYLKKFFGWVVRMEYIDRNPFDLLEIPKAPKKEVNHIYSPSEVDRIVKHFAADRKLMLMGLYIELLNHTAMRPGEAIKLMWHDVHDDHIVIDGKGGHRRLFPLDCPIGHPVRVVLRKIAVLRPSGRVEKLFPWNYGVPVTEELRTAKKMIGISDVDKAGRKIKRALHTFRATCEWLWKNQYGLSPEPIADLAGHSIAIHEKHYRANPSMGGLADAVAREAKRVVAIPTTNGTAR